MAQPMGFAAKGLTLFLCVVLFSCATEVKIIRETSSPQRPDWIVHPPQAADTVYFTGIASRAATLEEGLAGAVQDGIGRVSAYLGTKVKSEFTENTSLIAKELTRQISAKTQAKVMGAVVVDTYHEKMARVEGDYRLERYDVYVLIGFSTAQAEKELARQEKERLEKARMAHGYYVSGAEKQKRMEYKEARKLYSQTLSLLNELDSAVELKGASVGNTNELLLSAQKALTEVAALLRRVSITVSTGAGTQGDDVFGANLTAKLTEKGFTVTAEKPFVAVGATAVVTKSDVVMGLNSYYAEGSAGAKRVSDGQVIATVSFKTKGFHKNEQQAALNALAEAGAEAGTNLAALLEMGDFP
ncbi:MAG: hypothetical protein HZA04_06975 [Nitrospinae bacterium]|nr:hypothetical protein [Nitrospinota bacterium]